MKFNKKILDDEGKYLSINLKLDKSQNSGIFRLHKIIILECLLCFTESYFYFRFVNSFFVLL